MDKDPTTPEKPRPPIKSWFWLRTVPEGDAPLEIKQQWVGLLLPVRYERESEALAPMTASEIVSKAPVYVADRVVVELIDALKVLRLENKAEALDWLERLFKGNPREMEYLVFSQSEGHLMLSEIAERYFPGCSNFDSMED